MKTKLFIILTAFTLLTACSKDEQASPDLFGSSTLTITFEYTKQSGYGSNQFAVWIENSDGNLVKTLYATKFTASGGYKTRPDSLPEWVEKSGLAAMHKSDIDAVAGATPKEGTLRYEWKFNSLASSNPIPTGIYRFFVEGSTRGKNRTLHSGVIEIGVSPATEEAEVTLFLEESPGYPALDAGAPENAMISAVTAAFTP
ncbi:MAG: DUF2271 domain-containing protein [Oscillospiraceae bacterium]|nr:DUF2271 domain-containing protein [Oscillospiraceae bacterium]